MKKPSFLFCVVLIFPLSCINEFDIFGPVSGVVTVTTHATTLIAANSATSGGTIANTTNQVHLIDAGVCWSTSSNPSVADNQTNDGVGTGTFISNLIGLTPNTKYYVRAYVSDDSGSDYYGKEKSFKTLPQ